jgi:hypothetical protein
MIFVEEREYGSDKQIFKMVEYFCSMTKKEEQDLLVFERKIFRRAHGPKYENGECRTRTNRELE